MSPESASDDVAGDDKHPHGAVSTKEVDTGAQLIAGLSGTLDPREALRIRRKIDVHILPLMCTLYCVQFMDKITLGSAAILGIQEGAHLSTNEYNWLGTVFYISYLVFEYPQNLALQRYPVGKWISFNVLIWGTTLCCHAACKNFTGLLVVRLLLGVCEGCIISGFMIVTSMFYTRNEQTVRVGYWYLMNGMAQIILGFISFGTLHIKTKFFQPWQWLMIITGLATLILGILFWLFFPDSPTTAWFLKPDERVKAVQRIKENQTGVENKHFKKEQMHEALCDPKTWLFALFFTLADIPNSLTNQNQIIVASFGFTNLQTTLLGCVNGFVVVACTWTAVKLAARIPNSRAYVGVAYFIPGILGVLLINLLPWSDNIGLLFGQWISGMGGTAFVLALSWVSSVTAGHTKKVVTNAIVISAFCLGNALGPFMWQAKYKPRNHIPWAVIGICYVICPILLLTIRVLLVRENRKRDAELSDGAFDEMYIERVGEDGKIVEVKVDKEFLDLTDRQNRDFRYVL